MSDQSPKSSETSSKKKSTLYPKNRFRTIFLREMKYGENGNYKRHGFKASEIYYAMTGEIPEIAYYKTVWIGDRMETDYNKPVYRIDTLDEFQQEFILDGLEGKYKQRLEQLKIFHLRNRREDEERYQNFISYVQQKSKLKSKPGS